MKNEATERAYMGAEDADIPDEEENHPQHPPPPSPSSWDMYYDESYDPPVPWWLNSATGESTWDCPTTWIPAEQGDLVREDVVSESDRRQQLAVVEPEDTASSWVQQWSEEHQVTKQGFTSEKRTAGLPTVFFFFFFVCVCNH